MCDLTPAQIPSLVISERSSNHSSSYWLALNHLENIGDYFLEHSPASAAIHDHLKHEINTLLEKLRSSDNTSFQSRFDTTVSALLKGYTPFSQLELIEATGSGPREKVNIELLGFILACAKIAETGEGVTSEINDFHDECGWKLSSRQLGNDLLSIYQNYATESDGLLHELLSDYRKGNKASDSAIMLLGFFAPLASLVRMDTPLVIEQVISENSNTSNGDSTFGTLHRIIETLPWSAPTLELTRTTELEPVTLTNLLPSIKHRIHHINTETKRNILALYSGGQILIYSLDDNTILYSVSDKRRFLSPPDRNSFSSDRLYPNLLSIDPTGKWLAYGRRLNGKQQLKILDLQSSKRNLTLINDGIDFIDENQKLKNFKEYIGDSYKENGIHKYAWSPNGEYIAVTGSTNRAPPPVHLFKRGVNTFNYHSHLGDFGKKFQDGGPVLAFSPDSKFMIIGDSRGIYIKTLSSLIPLCDPIVRTYGAVRDVAITQMNDKSQIYVLTDEEMLLLEVKFDENEGFSCRDIGRIRYNLDFPEFIKKPENGIVHILSDDTSDIQSFAFNFSKNQAELFLTPSQWALYNICSDKDENFYAISSDEKLVKFSLKEIETEIKNRCDWL